MQRTRACNGLSGKSGVFIASVRPALGANTLAFDTVHLSPLKLASRAQIARSAVCDMTMSKARPRSKQTCSPSSNICMPFVGMKAHPSASSARAPGKDACKRQVLLTVRPRTSPENINTAGMSLGFLRAYLQRRTVASMTSSPASALLTTTWVHVLFVHAKASNVQSHRVRKFTVFAFGLASLAPHCFLQFPSARLVVEMVPGCCWAYSAFSV